MLDLLIPEQDKGWLSDLLINTKGMKSVSGPNRQDVRILSTWKGSKPARERMEDQQRMNRWAERQGLVDYDREEAEDYNDMPEGMEDVTGKSISGPDSKDKRATSAKGTKRSRGSMEAVQKQAKQKREVANQQIPPPQEKGVSVKGVIPESNERVRIRVGRNQAIGHQGEIIDTGEASEADSDEWIGDIRGERREEQPESDVRPRDPKRPKKTREQHSHPAMQKAMSAFNENSGGALVGTKASTLPTVRPKSQKGQRGIVGPSPVKNRKKPRHHVAFSRVAGGPNKRRKNKVD